MHTGTMPNEKSPLPRWLHAAFALLLAVLLVWGANPGHAAGEETITYIHTDISGNPLAATDENGDVIWKESYQAYGTRWQQDPGSAQQTQWFHGKEQDATSGLQYFGARYYDPAIGRFLGADPLGFQDGNLHSFNRYAYGNNNPVRYLDPDGNNAVTAFGGLLTESYNFAMGRGFDGAMVWGALQDGYNGEGAGLGWSVAEDVLSFGGGSAVAGGVTKGLRILYSSSKTTRVGRWMSQAEYNAMKTTGKVQESRIGATYVANPADRSAFYKQAKSGSVYVEFNVPSSSLIPTQKGWARIAGPNTLDARVAAKKGLPIPKIPDAKKITMIEHKP